MNCVVASKGCRDEELGVQNTLIARLEVFDRHRVHVVDDDLGV